eukprot:TRINITY_DN12846_c0_g1_i1.p1 TRINITY_DN12846_c0_g1~~TRINITY_DN12846_c0_g1_i1.p1  ORF type:complete len:252 (+),score=45.68 TRINITY_DN12846_c0_g1_i1:99-854(+)
MASLCPFVGASVIVGNAKIQCRDIKFFEAVLDRIDFGRHTRQPGQLASPSAMGKHVDSSASHIICTALDAQLAISEKFPNSDINSLAKGLSVLRRSHKVRSSTQRSLRSLNDAACLLRHPANLESTLSELRSVLAATPEESSLEKSAQPLSEGISNMNALIEVKVESKKINVKQSKAQIDHDANTQVKLKTSRTHDEPSKLKGDMVDKADHADVDQYVTAPSADVPKLYEEVRKNGLIFGRAKPLSRADAT